MVYGALCGLLLGISEPWYLVLVLLAIPGGIVAGLEHASPKAGALRGVLGGLLFGTALVVTHALIGNAAKSKLPDPHMLFAVLTTINGAILGCFGAWYRRRRTG